MYAPDGCAVRMVDLPYKVGAMVAFDEDGFASIYLNARWPRDRQKKALRHELRHIENNDAYNDKDIRAIEREADGQPVYTDYKLHPCRDVERNMRTLRRLGIITEDWRRDALLGLTDGGTYET